MWIEIFRGGKQVDSKGKEHDGDGLISRALDTFDPKYHEPPVVIGHPEDNAPAFGWVEELKKTAKDGVSILAAKIKQMPPEFKSLIEKGFYKKRSASFYPDGKLRHVGFLGAMPPSIKGLTDIAMSDSDFIPFEFEAFDEYQEVKTFSEADLIEAKERAAEEARRRAEAEFAEKEKKQLRIQRKKEVSDWISGKVKDGCVPPFLVDGGLIEFLDTIDSGVEFEFSEGEKKDPVAWFQWFTERMGKFSLFTEIATKEKAGAKDDQYDIQLGKDIATRVNQPTA